MLTIRIYKTDRGLADYSLPQLNVCRDVDETQLSSAKRILQLCRIV